MLQTFALNSYTVDALTASSNTLGYPTNLTTLVSPYSTYLNSTLLNAEDITSAEITGSTNYLNLLLTRRRSSYGWNWTATHQQDHPVLRREYRKNKISVVSASNGNISHYRLSPVSMRGRPVLVNFDDTKGNSTTLRMTNNNEEIFFNDRNFNNIQNISLDEIVTPYEQIVPMLRDGEGYTLNWVLYTQNLFPSLRNAFSSSATNKSDFSNGFWRTAFANRLVTGSQTSYLMADSNTITDIGLNSMGSPVSQSSWPLDASQDFLTRTTASSLGPHSPLAVPQNRPALENTYKRFVDPSGELQNHYTFDFNGFRTAARPVGWDSAPQDREAFTTVAAGALYSRKHMLAGVRSVVAPTGVRIAETGSLFPWQLTYVSGVFPLSASLLDQLYAGEALWEADSQAGIITINADGSRSFESTASAPWYDSYEDFRDEIKLVAKDYSIVPEFRISTHVDGYLKDGLFNHNRFDTFEIPGTPHNSSTSSFYADYSNSEFMKDFLKVKTDSGLKAAQIKLECSALIKFNPYKGFYPAQRTLDLVSKFSSSYMGDVVGRIGAPSAQRDVGAISYAGYDVVQVYGGLTRPLLQPFVAPGILFNTIKAGIAVDFPIVTDGTKLHSGSVWTCNTDPGYDADTIANFEADGLWAMWGANSSSVPPKTGLGGSILSASAPGGYSNTGSFFDLRIPFEGIIAPETYLRNTEFLDMESHPSVSFGRYGNIPNAYGGATASWNGTVQSPTLYTLMARNFFGSVAEFYLKDNNFSQLESGIVGDNLQFTSGSIYAARLKLLRSTTGPRTYDNDYAPLYGKISGSSPWGSKGARSLQNTTVRTLGGRDQIGALFPQYGSASYPVPQDPNNNPAFRETFTMYSRPSAFGPPFAGRLKHDNSSYRLPGGTRNAIPGNIVVDGWEIIATQDTSTSGTMDCFNGYNWAFTPPYYHGEAWVDFIFKPTSSVPYDLERILAETETVYWRVDSGCPMFSFRVGREEPGTSELLLGKTNVYGREGTVPLVPDYANRSTNVSFTPSTNFNPWPIYAGNVINDNAMQISASINLKGLENVLFEERDKFGNLISQRNTSIGKKWVIKPKMETPMLNFNDLGVHPITSASATLTVPVYSSASVPRGMWHQFGTIPEDPAKGVFLEIGDIPQDWLLHHWKVINQNSIYNNNSADILGPQMASQIQSFSKLVGFDKTQNNRRLGEMPEERTIKEGVVAIPYIVESVERPQDVSGDLLFERKKFIEIPKQRYEAALSFAQGSADGDSLQTAGPSIRKLIQSMKNFVLPPQFDFINNPTVKPIVMYIFEFEYKFDRDDLSYMWQNLAPRKSRTMKLEKSSISHNLMDLELLNEDNIMDNANLRWMVFKVKQKAQTDYYDLVPTQVGGAEVRPSALRAADQRLDSTYEVGYNWPYDYLSFVEKIKMDAQVLYKSDGATAATPSGPEGGGMPLEGTPEAFEGQVVGDASGTPRAGSGGATPTTETPTMEGRRLTTRVLPPRGGTGGGGNEGGGYGG